MAVNWNDLVASTDMLIVRLQETLEGNEIVKGKVWRSGNANYETNDIVYYCVGGFSMGLYNDEEIYCIPVEKVIAKEE